MVADVKHVADTTVPNCISEKETSDLLAALGKYPEAPQILSDLELAYGLWYIAEAKGVINKIKDGEQWLKQAGLKFADINTYKSKLDEAEFHRLANEFAEFIHFPGCVKSSDDKSSDDSDDESTD